MKTNIQQSISRVNTACYSPRTHLNPGFFLVECRSLPLVLSLSGIENIKTFQLSYGAEEGSLTDKYCFLLRMKLHDNVKKVCDVPDVQRPASPLVVLDSHSPFPALQHSDKR